MNANGAANGTTNPTAKSAASTDIAIHLDAGSPSQFNSDAPTEVELTTFAAFSVPTSDESFTEVLLTESNEAQNIQAKNASNGAHFTDNAMMAGMTVASITGGLVGAVLYALVNAKREDQVFILVMFTLAGIFKVCLDSTYMASART